MAYQQSPQPISRSSVASGIVLWTAVARARPNNVLICTQHEPPNVNIMVDGKSPLAMAIKKRHMRFFRMLMSHPQLDPECGTVECTKRITVHKKTPLFLAIEAEHSDMVRALLNHHKVNPNNGSLKVFRGWSWSSVETPLFLASANGQTKIVKHLLNDSRISPNKISKGRYTPLSIAWEKKKVATFWFLFGHPKIARWTVLNCLVWPTDQPVQSEDLNGLPMDILGERVFEGKARIRLPFRAYLKALFDCDKYPKEKFPDDSLWREDYVIVELTRPTASILLDGIYQAYQSNPGGVALLFEGLVPNEEEHDTYDIVYETA